MSLRRSRLGLLLGWLAVPAACSLEAGGLGGADVVESGADRFEDGAAEIEDAPVDRDDGWADDGVPDDADGIEIPDLPEAEDDAGPDETPEVAEAIDVPETVEDVAPDELADLEPEDVPPVCSGGLTWCGSGCVDTTSDPLHCGGCDLPCGSGPHATASCIASVCSVACETGWGDCNGVAADGCETDLTASVADCGTCGLSCGAPLHGAARCTAGRCAFDCESGYVLLEGRCVAFGGAYLFAECSGGVCRNPNPFTGGCSCPPGFTASPAFRLVNDCVSPTYVWASLHFCSAPSFAADSDWGGAYHRHDSGVCVVGNPYTGRCACPAGTAPISWRVETADFRFSSIGLCWSAVAVEVTFAGAFEIGDVGSPCLVVNPETGGCSCPSGATRVNYRGIFAHGSPYGDWGTQMPICYR